MCVCRLAYLIEEVTIKLLCHLPFILDDPFKSDKTGGEADPLCPDLTLLSSLLLSNLGVDTDVLSAFQPDESHGG